MEALEAEAIAAEVARDLLAGDTASVRSRFGLALAFSMRQRHIEAGWQAATAHAGGEARSWRQLRTTPVRAGHVVDVAVDCAGGWFLLRVTVGRRARVAGLNLLPAGRY